MRTFGSRLLFPLVLAVVMVAGGAAHAQVAPTGAHYGARASDTGYGSTTPSGGYAASIPLELPTPRGGIPVPLQIGYGRRGVGAAGAGWDIPLTYVQRTDSLAHRRPRSFPANEPLQGFERLVLVMDGREISMVEANGAWVAHQDAPQLALTEDPSSNTWKLQDGDGATWWFEQPPQLAAAGIWLLSAIYAPAAGNAVELDYEVAARAFPGGEGVSIDLVAIRYDVHPDEDCRKYEIALAYTPPSVDPLSLSFIGDAAVVRMRTVYEVAVNARASCASPLETIRAYKLDYEVDPDTRMPRLQGVRLRGRDGTPEAATTLPLEQFEYGSATWQDPLDPGARKLRYQKGTDVALPSEVDQAELSSTYRDNSVSVPSGKAYATWQSLTDVTGDGRPDLVYRKNDDLWVALNRPAVGGSTTLGAGAALAPLGDLTFDTGPLAKRASPNKRFDYGDGQVNPDEVWRQTIDFDGDGRLDVIDAAEEADNWVVYLNTPGNTPSGITWERRSIAIYPLRQVLEAQGYEVDDDWIPLSRRVSGKTQQYEMCWESQGDGTYELTSGTSCGEPSEFDPDATQSWKPLGMWREVTFTEWELQDVNGDGYPDFVFGSAPTPMTRTGEPTLGGIPFGALVPGTVAYQFGWNGGSYNSVRVAFNGAGVRFYNTIWPFAEPVIWDPLTSCGVSGWMEDGTNDRMLAEYCGNVDVNGDGLLDRAHGATVRLGGGAALTGVEIELPGVLTGPERNRPSRQISDHKNICETDPPAPGSASYSTQTLSALRDLSGDGIPDFVEATSVGWQVHLGTGFGFAPPIAVVAPGGPDFALSLTEELCDGSDSWTFGGLFDLDGDGKPDVVRVGANGNLEIWQLRGDGALRAADAGRLTVVDNGHGAKTKIGWRSAKDDATTRHQLPHAELVVDSVQTLGKLGLGGTGPMTRYAYGDASMIFDPRRDAWISPGYGRTVALTVDAAKGSKGPGTATITDALPLPAFGTTLTAEQRYGRYALAGRVKDVWTLSGTLSADPWQLLTADMSTDTRRTAGVHNEWSTRAEAPMPAVGDDDCLDVPYPYDWLLSFFGVQNVVAYDFCHAHGFAYLYSTMRWHGDKAPPSQLHVSTRSEVMAIDDFGRVTKLMQHNDTHRSDDDVCIETSFAAPGSSARVLGAVSARQITDCKLATTLAGERYEYDDLPWGQVTLGYPTAHLVDRRDAETGALLDTIRVLDASYDAVGNVVEVLSTREDGAVRRTSTTYDPFGLAPVAFHIEADGAADQDTSEALDELTLAPLASTDENGTVRAQTLDGFGRVVRRLAAPPGGKLDVTVATTYLGFAGGDPLGRRVRTKTLGDPTPEADIGNAPGQVVTVFLDEVGRERRTEVDLGSDYSELLTKQRTYDGMGRASFESDLHPLSQAEATAYGTSYHYNPDGSARCSVRGYGPQAYTNVTKESAERYPTCYERTYANHTQTFAVREADSLLSTAPQAGVVRSTTLTAIDRVLSQQTYKANVLVEYADYGYDRLGHTTRLRRYKTPSSLADPVTWKARYDSLDLQLRVDEPESATRHFTYSDWGQLLEIQWNDGGNDRRVTRQYDGLGRLVHAADQENGSEIPESAHTYVYDDSPAPVAEAHADYQRGRLALTKSPTGSDWFGYDAWGNRSSHTASDSSGEVYVQRADRHGDGRLQSIDFFLPDTGYQLERVKYGHDSAQRLRTITFSGPNDSALLYDATDVDAWGRVRSASYGNAVTYKADYADLGRRLPVQTDILSAQGTRSLIHLAWDPVGRERSRRDTTDTDPLGAKTNLAYDALGRISKAARSTTNAILYSAQFAHDALGNTVSLADGVVNADADLTYRTVDRDRICRVEYGGGLTGSACNVVHDGVGNVVEMPTRTSTRYLEWLPSGQVRVMKEGNATATFHYDAFGQVAELDVEGNGTLDLRRDRRFGNLVERRDQMVGGKMQSVVVRNVPGDAGVVAMRRGPDAKWIFAHGEQRGSRWLTDESGAFVQDVDYRPYGEAASTGSQPGSAEYTTWQWNGGDALAAFGVSHLGARLYDPVIGRFLSRDPMQVQRTAATSNPYAFALGDPWNRSDPSGLDVGCSPDGSGCGGPGIFDWLFLSIHGSPSTIPGSPPKVSPVSPFAPPGFGSYDPTFDPATDISELTPVEGAIFATAIIQNLGNQLRSKGTLRSGDLPGIKLFASAAVIQHRIDTRFGALGSRPGAVAPNEIFDAYAARRAFLHEGDDAAIWENVASKTPPLFGKRFFEVWGHGNSSGMFRTHVGSSLGADAILSELQFVGWEPGDPIVLVGCKTGADLAIIAQQVADRANSLVIGSRSNIIYSPIPGRPGEYYPLLAPWGWSYWLPARR